MDMNPPILDIDNSITINEPPKVEKPKPMDPSELYARIRECVTPSAFEEFAVVIGRFNNGYDTDLTIQALGSLIPDSFLVDQMTRLIVDATRP